MCSASLAGDPLLIFRPVPLSGAFPRSTPLADPRPAGLSSRLFSTCIKFAVRIPIPDIHGLHFAVSTCQKTGHQWLTKVVGLSSQVILAGPICWRIRLWLLPLGWPRTFQANIYSRYYIVAYLRDECDCNVGSTVRPSSFSFFQRESAFGGWSRTPDGSLSPTVLFHLNFIASNNAIGSLLPENLRISDVDHVHYQIYQPNQETS
jgi:hypothetical protein